MPAILAEPPDRAAALRACRSALRRIASYVLNPALDRRMLDFGERKESLDPNEYAELLALIAFTQQRSVEKLEAELALRHLDSAYPEPAAES